MGLDTYYKSYKEFNDQTGDSRKTDPMQIKDFLADARNLGPLVESSTHSAFEDTSLMQK